MNKSTHQTTSAHSAADPAYGTPTPATEPRSTSTSNESVPHLIRSLASDVSTLMSKEIALAKAEMREAANEAKKGLVGMTTGAILALGGLIVLLMAGVYGLADAGLELWLAALIVGGLALLIGVIMAKSGQSKLEPDSFVPHRTIDSAQKDMELAGRKTS